ncbi:DUF3558 domain-containing protein [Mycobacteroides chelonae]|uniref:DUF3558 domain-containing protein n=1 Tax=Mycobacteroides chelonae TaxID=1774 RepID=UPI0006189DC1|nr:DUF3558 domain-containing protein [Mycobacteroides chelonae]AKC38722.1 hypothetical protein GR01_09355 [Mycobacteroides chelonae]ANA97988.1 hypothetical protein BB28_09870 [Mycobacteroides chelonae CCUG 47445]OLT78054.1 hypothetical protein BKG56_13770 [Mycobacteroides chelonae]
MLLRRLALVSTGVVLAACGPSVPGTPVTSPLPTNDKGHTRITFDPCKEIPANVIAQQKLDSRPPEPNSINGGGVENYLCKYRAQSGYYLSISASNYTLEMDKKDTTHWGYRDFEINGRKALSFYLSTQPRKDGCAIDVAASTGVYGVLVSDGLNGFDPYPDCLSAAQANIEAFMPYFPY